jgi:hypothetical protein
MTERIEESFLKRFARNNVRFFFMLTYPIVFILAKIIPFIASIIMKINQFIVMECMMKPLKALTDFYVKMCIYAFGIEGARKIEKVVNKFFNLKG